MGLNFNKIMNWTVGCVVALGVGTGLTLKIISEANDEVKHTLECVEARETIGINGKIRLKKCVSNPEIEMSVQDSFKSYAMHTSLKDIIYNKNTVKKIDFNIKEEAEDGSTRFYTKTYKRETGPQELFDKADKKWKEYWKEIEGDSVMLDWSLWKSSEERRLKEIKQYGDTVKSLVDKL